MCIRDRYTGIEMNPVRTQFLVQIFNQHISFFGSDMSGGCLLYTSYNMVGGWPSYTTDGYVNEYSANGKFTNKYNVGVGPCGLTFLLK